MSILRNTRQNIRRSPYQAIAAILVAMLTFFDVIIFTFFLAGSERVVRHFEAVPQVNAFFRNDAKESDIKALEEKLKKTGKVSSIKFISHQEAFKIYKERFEEDDPLLLELVTPELLPRSFNVATFKIEDLSSISEILKGSSHVEKVVFQEEVVSNLRTWTEALRKIGIGLILARILASIFVIVAAVSIKIAQKKEDIEIMRLIGATSWYIRWPFILEGIFYGIVGALLGFLAALGALWYAMPYLSSFLSGIPIFPISPLFFLGVLGGELLLAIILGSFASFIAVLRYLK